MKKNKHDCGGTNCNRNAEQKSVFNGEWYCWVCFSHLEEEQSVREQAQPIQED